MWVSDGANGVSDPTGKYNKKLYCILSSDKYSIGQYKKEPLGEGMELVNQDICGWWKPRFILDHDLKKAYQWMRRNQRLASVGPGDVDWDSMGELPEEAMMTLRTYSFNYPSFIRCFRNGIAEVMWQLVPDGYYWMDNGGGYGMAADIELNIYGFIDRETNIVSRFHYYSDNDLRAGVLERVRNQVELAISGCDDAIV